MAGPIGDEPPNDAQSVWPAIQCGPRFVVADVDCERGDLSGRNIGRIAHDRVEPLARDRSEKIAQWEIDSIRNSTVSRISARDFNGRLAHIGRHELGSLE